MAEVKTLTYVVEIDGKQVTKELKSVEDYNERIAQLKKDIDKQPIGSKAYKDLQKELKKTEGSLKVAQAANQSFLDSMASTPGIIGTIGQSLKGFGDQFSVLKGNALKFASAVGGNGVKAMKAFRIALASTGVGALVVALGALVAYFTQTEKGTRVIKVAMEALGVIVGNITSWFAELGEGMVNAFSNPKQALIDFGNLIKDQIVNRVMGMLELLPALGKAISLAFKGEFKEAAKTAGDAVGKVVLGVEDVTDKVGNMITNVVEQTKAAVKAGDRIVGLERKIRDTQQALLVRNAEIKKQLEEQRKIADNTTLSYDERAAALKKVNELNDELANNIVKEASLNEQLLQQQIALEGNYEKREELETQLAQATAERIAKEQEASIIRLEASQKQAEIDLQEIDRKRQIGDIIKQTNLETVQSEYDKQAQSLQAAREAAIAQLDLLRATEEEKLAVLKAYDELEAQLEIDRQNKINEILSGFEATEEEKAIAQIQKERDAKLKELEDYKATEEEKARLTAYYQGEIDKVREDSAKKAQELEELQLNAKLDLAKGALSVIQEVAGEGTAVGKAAAVAQTTIDTYQSATAAYKAMVGIPVVGPALAPVAAGVAIAAGLANVRKILSVSKDGKSSPSGGGGGGRGGNSALANYQSGSLSTRSGGFNGGGIVNTSPQLNANTQSVLNDNLSSSLQGGVKAYVVSSDITSQQQLDRKTQTRSTL